MSVNAPHFSIQVAERCDLCGSGLHSNHSRLATGKISVHGFEANISTILCKTCTFIFQPEVFSEQCLASLYRRDSGFAIQENKSNKHLLQCYKKHRQNFITQALKRTQGPSVLRILDVGGGVGECTEHLADDHQVTVLDANSQQPKSPKVAKKIGLFETASFAERFDVIVMNHVLEHTFSPSTFLNKAAKALTCTGRLIIEVPYELFTPIVFRKTGDWRHVAYFSRNTLRLYLLKAGFSVCRLWIDTGYYGDRSLPVIRAIAVRFAGKSSVPFSGGIWTLARDLLNPRAASLTLLSRITRQ